MVDTSCNCSMQKRSGERELAALKSVARCLEEYKLDPSELADFHINERIARLEKDIAEAEQKLQQRSLKRKVGEVTGPSENPEGKRPWLAAAISSPRVAPELIRQLHDQKIDCAPSNPNLFYKNYVPINMLDAGFQGLHGGGPNGAEVRPGNNGRPFYADTAHSSLMGHPPSGGASWLQVSPLQAGRPNLYLQGGPQASSLADRSGNGSGSSAADLYKFADAVLERESCYGNSGASYAAPRPSYFPSLNS